MNVTIEMQGGDKLLSLLKKIGYIPQSLPSILFQEGESIMSASKAEVPVDLGNLRATGHVQAPVVTSQSVEVLLGYGGPAVDYAIVVHENLEAHHTVGKAKYLEDPALRAAKGMGQRIATRIKALEGLT